MIYYAKSYGTCGEFVQGNIDDCEYISSYKIDRYSYAFLEEQNSNEFIYDLRYQKSIQAINKVLDYFNLDKGILKDLSLKIHSNIKIGKGMSSSSADITASIYAILNYLNKELDYNTLSKLICEIEPSDPVYMNQNIIFDSINGNIKEYLGCIDGFKVILLEPKNTFDTLNLRKTKDYKIIRKRNEKYTKKAFMDLKRGFKESNLRLIGQSSIESAFLNQEILYKDRLEEILKLSKIIDCYGFNIAHSGTVIGFLVHEEFDIKDMKKIIRQNKKLDIYKNIEELNLINEGASSGIIKEGGGLYELYKNTK
ncbi:cobalamin biosynthesis protein [Peptostreptococcaceae bacterium AGR-M142]